MISEEQWLYVRGCTYLSNRPPDRRKQFSYRIISLNSAPHANSFFCSYNSSIEPAFFKSELPPRRAGIERYPIRKAGNRFYHPLRASSALRPESDDRFAWWKIVPIAPFACSSFVITRHRYLPAQLWARRMPLPCGLANGISTSSVQSARFQRLVHRSFWRAAVMRRMQMGFPIFFQCRFISPVRLLFIIFPIHSKLNKSQPTQPCCILRIVMLRLNVCMIDISQLILTYQPTAPRHKHLFENYLYAQECFSRANFNCRQFNSAHLHFEQKGYVVRSFVFQTDSWSVCCL